MGGGQPTGCGQVQQVRRASGEEGLRAGHLYGEALHVSVASIIECHHQAFQTQRSSQMVVKPPTHLVHAHCKLGGVYVLYSHAPLCTARRAHKAQVE